MSCWWDQYNRFFCLILWTTKQVGGFQGENQGFGGGADSLLTLTVRVHWRQHAKERLSQSITDMVSSCRHDGQLESLWSKWSRPSVTHLPVWYLLCLVFLGIFSVTETFLLLCLSKCFSNISMEIKTASISHTDSQEQIGPYNCFHSVWL